MTYHDLLTQVETSIEVLALGTAEEFPIDYDGAQTTTVRYAVKKNRDQYQDEIERFRELLQEKAEDIDEDPETLQEVAQSLTQGQVNGAPDDVVDAAKDVLETETGFDPYTITEEALMEEESVPLPIIDVIDWMVDDG